MSGKWRDYPIGQPRPPLLPLRNVGNAYTITWLPFSAGELIAAREHLNVSAGWLAAALAVTDRTVRNWEAARTAVPEAAAATIRDMLAHTVRAEDWLIEKFRPSGRLRPVLWVYRSDAELASAHPDADLYWPASWYRAMYVRVIRAGVPCRIAVRPTGFVSSRPKAIPWGGGFNPRDEAHRIGEVVAWGREMLELERESESAGTLDLDG